MLKDTAIWRILENHHPSERFFILFAVADKIKEVLVVHS